MDRKAVSPVIAIVLLLMMTVAAAGAAYFWLTQMQSGIQEQSTESIENIVSQSGRKLMAQAAICEPTAPEGMVAWYEFYEGGGNKTHDSSKNENTGTLYPGSDGGITTDSEMWAEGKAGKALKFDGNDSYVGVSDSNSLDISSANINFSIGLWIKPSSEEQQHVYKKQRTGGEWEGYWAHYNNWGNQRFYTGFEDANGNKAEPHSSSLSPEEWYHIYAVKEEDTVSLYINTEFIASESTDFNTTFNNPDPLYIGSSIGGEHSVDGLIDEVRIYDRALSAEEVNETYKGKMKVKVTVRNVGSVKIPEAKFVANLKEDGTTVDTDTYTTTSSIKTDELRTLTFYFNEMRPGRSYNVNIPGIDVSQSVSCQSLE